MIDSFSASPPTVAPGDTVTVAVSAHDPDCTSGTCTSGCGKIIRSDIGGFSADGGTFLSTSPGTAGSPYTTSAIWQAPAAEGTFTIVIDLADNGGSLCGGRLWTQAKLQVQVTTITSQPPVVTSLTAEPARLLVKESSALACAAADPDGDPITYGWSADGGQLVAGTDGAATFSSHQAGLFTLTCTATDSFGLEGSSTTKVSVTSGVVDVSLDAGLTTPMRIDVNDAGELYVVDRGFDGLVVVDLNTGRELYHRAMPGVSAVAVDWAGRLVVGGQAGARVTDTLGATLFELAGDAGLGPVADVAVDRLARRYAVVHPFLGRVAIYDESGTPVTAFGSTGDGAAELRGPQGVAFAPDGAIVVADSEHGLIKVFSPAGLLLRSFGGTGGGAGKFVRLDDVASDAAGTVYASDSFQDWVQVFDASGVARDTLGTWGDQPGELMTAAGITVSEGFARLVVASSNGSRLELFRTGTATSPRPEVASPALDPSSLVFAPVAIGAASAAQSVTLTNGGGSRLGIAAIGIEGDFTQSNDCGPVLDLGASCRVQVTFTPTAEGARAGLLRVETSGEPQLVAAALSGDGFAAGAAVRLVPAALDFGAQAVGTVSSPQSVQLTNIGSAPFSLTAISTTGEFTVSTACPQTLPAGAGCPIFVSYAPATRTDQALGALNVASDAPGSPHAVLLSGSSTPAVPSFSIGDASTDEPPTDGTAVARFTLTLSRPTTVPVEVAWATAEATATEGEDYDGASGVATIAAGGTEATVEVNVLGDDVLEPDEEWFRVTLSDPVGAEIADGSADGIIRDDELCLGQNLLANAGAEARPAADGALPGWQPLVGASWRRQPAPPTPYEGRYSFYSGAAAYGELVQDVDVRAFAASIDAGTQRFRFEAQVHTQWETTPVAQIVVEYRDLENLVALDVADSGAVLAPGGWTPLADEREAPAGTGWIRIRLVTLAPGGASFDALALRSLRAASVVVDDVLVDEGDSGFRSLLFPVRLACPYYQSISLGYATRDGSARETDDYLPAAGRLDLAAGEVVASMPVEIAGDLDDEVVTESFTLDLAADPGSPAVVADGSAEGRIRNDDFCSLTAPVWAADTASWPVDRLELGGVEYLRDQLVSILGYQGSSVTHRLARELAAAKLSYERGAKSDILPVVATADAFLERFPPGSNPKGKNKQQGDELLTQLAAYNERGCQ